MTQPTDTPPPAPRLDRLLGPTAGTQDGNVRATLALLGDLFLHALFALLLIAFFQGHADALKDFILATGGSLVTMDIAAVSFYYGKRSAGG